MSGQKIIFLPGYMKNRLIISLIITLLFCTSDCLAEGRGFPIIKWEKLNLTQTQQVKLKESDRKWERISRNLNTRIANNSTKLRRALCNPCSTDRQIRQLQGEIVQDQKTLRYQSMEIFLEKRAVLTPEQRKRLHESFR